MAKLKAQSAVVSSEFVTRLMDKDKREQKGACSKCKRWTWNKKELGTRCLLTQPDGVRCRGVFVPPDAV